MPSSPTKQRAALAPLDANAKPSLPSPKMSKDGTTPIIPLTGGSSPLKKSFSPSVTSGTKRSAEAMTSPGTKKPCIQENTRSRTTSPASPSLFDTSTEGDSWATTTTEPEIGIVSDAPALLAPRQRGSLTREQAREKAEILRLRLGLASYKVRTGQTTVPLADLQRKPLPRKTVRVQSPREDASQSWRRSNSPASVSGLVGLAMGDS
ncbi:whi5 like domain-containing protein [Pochonia chlamydosporia 170]|uniref:Whi5 like domain-containing protein n=1 Tax=Pochonia chlamydosporia 170 TaxID=1380566 RepID=A0A179FYP5_METCM|nr:whi5 like domain-containing protein [Pochonia chlamydosporia 170]OAQ70089.1 whi5 like domain-containing protein [Pochonia chlamydosporia 170]